MDWLCKQGAKGAGWLRDTTRDGDKKGTRRRHEGDMKKNVGLVFIAFVVC